jgi:hypothetical protein
MNDDYLVCYPTNDLKNKDIENFEGQGSSTTDSYPDTSFTRFVQPDPSTYIVYFNIAGTQLFALDPRQADPKKALPLPKVTGLEVRGAGIPPNTFIQDYYQDPGTIFKDPMLPSTSVIGKPVILISLSNKIKALSPFTSMDFYIKLPDAKADELIEQETLNTLIQLIIQNCDGRYFSNTRTDPLYIQGESNDPRIPQSSGNRAFFMIPTDYYSNAAAYPADGGENWLVQVKNNIIIAQNQIVEIKRGSSLINKCDSLVITTSELGSNFTETEGIFYISNYPNPFVPPRPLPPPVFAAPPPPPSTQTTAPSCPNGKCETQAPNITTYIILAVVAIVVGYLLYITFFTAPSGGSSE